MNIQDDSLRAWLNHQTQIVSEQSFSTDFAHINYSDVVPVVTEGSEFAGSVAFVSTDAVGQASFMQGDADDVPLADIDASANIVPVQFGGIGYAYGYDEINRARAGNFDLTTKKADAARLAYEEFMQELTFVGNKAKGIKGLINQPTGKVTRDTDTFTTSTAEDILGLINKALMLTGANGSATADTVLVPYDLYAALASMVVANGTMTGLQFVQQNNVVTAMGRSVEIVSALGLDTGATGGGNRIVAYRRAPDTVELQLPMPHKFLDVYQAGPLRFEVPGVFRVAGVNVARKRDFAYLDEQ